MELKLAGIIKDSLSNGDGLRTVLFAQGCKHNCKGCFSLHTHNFNKPSKIVGVYEILGEILKNPLSKNVTFSGGDPFEQAEAFGKLAEELNLCGYNIWCYTGYTLDYIVKHRQEHKGWHQLLSNIDVIVDGKFEEDKQVEGLKFRGSYNQKIYNLRTGEEMYKYNGK